MIKLAVSGCQGRMGSRTMYLAEQDSDFALAALLESATHPSLGNKVGNIIIGADTAAIKNADVLIEFTGSEATLSHLKECQKYNVKMVIGTTGLLPEQIKYI